MCALLSISLVIAGIVSKDSLYFIAAGLFAIGAEISMKLSTTKERNGKYHER